MKQELKNQIKSYRHTNWKALLREDLGKHHLKEIKPFLDRIKDTIDLLIKPMRDIYLLSEDEENDLFNALTKFNEIQQKIQQHKDVSQNNELMEEFSKIAGNILDLSKPLLKELKEEKELLSNQVSSQSKADLKTDQSIVKEFKTELKETQEIKKEALQSQEAIKKIQKEALQSQEAIKRLQSQQEGQIASKEATQYGNFFKEEANRNERRSWLYGVFIILLSCVSCYLAYDFFSFDPNIQASTISELIIKGNLLNKIFVFSILFFLISLLSREYMALRHQCTLNQHRHNALASHKEILTSIKKTTSETDKEISNIILLELTKAMFTPQDTGFMKNQKTSSIGDKVIEISKPILKTPSTRE